MSPDGRQIVFWLINFFRFFNRKEFFSLSFFKQKRELKPESAKGSKGMIARKEDGLFKRKGGLAKPESK